jgi:hypothetical protein
MMPIARDAASDPKADLSVRKTRAVELSATADRSALVVIVSAIIQGPCWAVSKAGRAFQCVIWGIENQNILVGAYIIISIHKRTSIPSVRLPRRCR